MIHEVFRHLRQRFRNKRYQIIHKLTELDRISGFIIDLGGGPASFFAERYPIPKNVILIEINPVAAYRAKSKLRDINVIVADAEHLPLANNSVALTVCNSVIEHVENPEKLASEAQRISQRYFLQTPNGGFPLETHSFVAIPFFNVIPWEWTQQLVCKIFGANYDYVKSVRYLSETKLQQLFPQASISYERFLWLKKSFYVFHSGRDN